MSVATDGLRTLLKDAQDQLDQAVAMRKQAEAAASSWLTMEATFQVQVDSYTAAIIQLESRPQDAPAGEAPRSFAEPNPPHEFIPDEKPRRGGEPSCVVCHNTSGHHLHFKDGIPRHEFQDGYRYGSNCAGCSLPKQDPVHFGDRVGRSRR